MLPDRRQLLAGSAALLAGSATLGSALLGAARAEAPVAKPFRFMLNTSTIRGQKLNLSQQVAVAAKAGYDAIEPWLNDINAWVESGKSLGDVKKQISDAGLTVESAIGFAQWIVDDETQRNKGLEQAKRDMDVVLQLGGKRIAAPPAGAIDKVDLDLRKVAERYHALCEVGVKVGIVPQVELWGFSRNLSRLGEVAMVAIDSKHPKACILADVYHIHKGGSSSESLKLLGGGGLQVFHMNDYPANPPREKIVDANRVYPGDGVAPLVEMLRDLLKVGFRGHLSLELFNPEYWKQDANEVAKTGLAKMKAVVVKALA
jgi:sugar phosphate isomerase/epimerase